MNNPLRYTDPSGNSFLGFGGDFLLGFFKGLFNGDNPLKRGWHEAVNGVKIDAGLFAADTKQSGWGWQLFSRFTWQLPQTVLGWGFADIDNNFGKVTNVDYYAGATVLTGGHNGLLWGHGGQAMTLGNYIMGDKDIATDPNNSLFQHEYGHYLQSQAVGWAYLPGYALPSLLGDNNDYGHDYNPIEQDANARAIKYFYKRTGGNFTWIFNRNPIGYPGTSRSMADYNTSDFQSLLKSLRVSPTWYDYAGWLTGNGIILSEMIHSFYYSAHPIDYE